MSIVGGVWARVKASSEGAIIMSKPISGANCVSVRFNAVRETVESKRISGECWVRVKANSVGVIVVSKIMAVSG